VGKLAWPDLNVGTTAGCDVHYAFCHLMDL
jgi:hypothetical protein